MFVLITLIFIFLLYVFYKYFYSINKSLKCFPSPPEVPILGHALDFLSGREILDVLMDYTNIYGDVVLVKTGPQRELLLISNCELFEFFLSTRKILTRSVDYKFCSRWLGRGLITATGEEWKKHRRLITPAFSYSNFENFIDIFYSNANVLLEQFECYLDSTSVNIYPLINRCTLDIICECAMGTSAEAQKNANSQYVQSLKTMLEIIIKRSFSPYKMFDWIYFFTDDYKKEKKALEIIHSYTWDVIKRRQQERKLKNDKTEKKKKIFLDLLLDANNDGEHLTIEEIREEVDTFMFAGHDTTALAISFTLFCLANYPEEQDKVFLEQREIFGEDFKRTATLENLNNMKYLELVVKESLRLYPPGAVFSRQLDEDISYEGKVFPKGMTLTFFVYGLHRNPKYFSEAEKFLPDRFQILDNKMPSGYLPFGSGPRNCIGQKFAMIEVKSVVSKVVREFELLPSIPAYNMKLALKTLLTPANGICIRLKKRK